MVEKGIPVSLFLDKKLYTIGLKYLSLIATILSNRKVVLESY